MRVRNLQRRGICQCVWHDWMRVPAKTYEPDEASRQSRVVTARCWTRQSEATHHITYLAFLVKVCP